MDSSLYFAWCISSSKQLFSILIILVSQRKEGLPALLVYKGGQIVGNFVKLEDTFGEDFFAVDVESFLIE